MQRTHGVWWRSVRPHGLLCGLLMSVLAVCLRDWDVPVPLFAAALCTPYCALPGYLVARRDGVAMGVLAAAVAGATGHVMVFLVAVAYSAATQPWPKPLFWGLMGLLSLAVTFMLGMFFGRLGAALFRRPRRSIV